MISKKMEKALNEQIALEGYASFLYLAMANWCESQSLNGCAAFMHRQSAEERSHMMRLFRYLNEVGGKPITPGIKQPPHEWKSVLNMFEEVLKHEQKVTASIHELTSMCYDERDHATLLFLQWYVEEQREEEALMRSILECTRLIGDGPQSLYYIDKEVGAINRAEMAKEQLELGEEKA